MMYNARTSGTMQQQIMNKEQRFRLMTNSGEHRGIIQESEILDNLFSITNSG